MNSQHKHDVIFPFRKKRLKTLTPMDLFYTLSFTSQSIQKHTYTCFCQRGLCYCFTFHGSMCTLHCSCKAIALSILSHRSITLQCISRTSIPPPPNLSHTVQSKIMLCLHFLTCFTTVNFSTQSVALNSTPLTSHLKNGISNFSFIRKSYIIQ